MYDNCMIIYEKKYDNFEWRLKPTGLSFCHDILLKRIHWSCQLHANHGMALKRHQLQYSHDLILEDEA